MDEERKAVLKYLRDRAVKLIAMSHELYNKFTATGLTADRDVSKMIGKQAEELLDAADDIERGKHRS